MDRGQILLVGLPLFLLCSDLLTLFAPPPSKPSIPPPHHHRHRHHHQQQASTLDPLEFTSQKPSADGGVGFGSSVNIDFCSSCSYSSSTTVTPTTPTSSTTRDGPNWWYRHQRLWHHHGDFGGGGEGMDTLFLVLVLGGAMWL